MKERLKQLLAVNTHKRVCVAGASCIGKSTLVQASCNPNWLDMDELLAKAVSDEEIKYILGLDDDKPWTPEIGQRMRLLANLHIRIEPGKPVFATVFLECYVVIWMTTSMQEFARRAKLRDVDPGDVRRMDADLAAQFKNLTCERHVLLL